MNEERRTTNHEQRTMNHKIPWTPFQPLPDANFIAQALNDLPPHWSLTPLWEKRPYRDGWQAEPFIPHAEIARILRQGEERISKRTGQPYLAFCSGYGLRLGEVSHGLLAIDVDGNSAETLLGALTPTPLPDTVSWTSGKNGRRQLLYQIPDAYRNPLQHFRRKTLTQWEDITTETGELLEFRYNQHQSVLPPSFHQKTGHYHWLTSPQDFSVAFAPLWLCQFLLAQSLPKASPMGETRQKAKPLSVDSPLHQTLTEAIDRLTIQQIYYWSGHQFQQCGDTWRGYCPRHQSQSGTAFSLNPQTKQWYCFGCEVGGGPVQYRHFLQGGNGHPKGNDFRVLVQALATEAGLEQETIKDVSSSFPDQSYQPTQVIHQQYFDWEIPKTGTILAVKSSLGSGKTTWLGKVVSALKTEGWLALGHRNSLLLQSCERWGFIHLQTTPGAFDLVASPYSQLALCVDSLHHFSPEALAGKNIIIDESIAVVSHLLMGETLKQKRQVIIQRFSQALKMAKRIFCLDGMLTDWCVDYLRDLAGKDRRLIKVENRYQGKGFRIKFLEESWDDNGKRFRNDRSPLLQQLWLSSRPVVCTDSQLEAEALDQLLAQTQKQGLRIDSKTISSPEVQSFLKHPNAYLQTKTPHYLIYTPAAEAGVDISICDYFTDQFCFFFGVLQTNGQQQMISRVRDPKIQRWLWCSRYGKLQHRSNCFQFPFSLTEAIQSLILKTGKHLLAGKDTAAVVEQFIHQVTTATTDPHYQTFCVLKAIQNYEQSHLWNCLHDALEKKGHHIELITLPSYPETKQQEKRAKETVKLLNAEAIYRGDGRQGKQAENTHRLLRKKLPGIEETPCWNPQFIKRVLYDDRSFILQQERFWLIHHPEIATQLKRSFPSLDSPQQWSIIEDLIFLNLRSFLNLETTWNEKSLALQFLPRKLQETTLPSVLKLNPKTNSALSLFRELLRLIGVKLSRQNGQYQINSNAWYDFDRITILACLDRRWKTPLPSPHNISEINQLTL